MKKTIKEKPTQIQLIEASSLPELNHAVNDFLESNPSFKLNEIQHLQNDFFLSWLAVLGKKKRNEDGTVMDFLEITIADKNISTKLSSKDTELINRFKSTLKFGEAKKHD